MQGGTQIGSLTIPANSLTVGKFIDFQLIGTVTIANATTFTVQIILGGVVIAYGTTGSLSAVTGSYWLFDQVYGHGFQVQSIGSSGKIIGMQCVNFSRLYYYSWRHRFDRFWNGSSAISGDNQHNSSKPVRHKDSDVHGHQ